MILYHGTNKDFDKIDITKSNIKSDFGIGYYLTNDYNTAKEWSKRKKGDSIVLSYEISDDIIEKFGYKIIDKYEWINIVMLYRDINKDINELINVKDFYDNKMILIGPILDNNFFKKLIRFNSIRDMSEFFISNLELNNSLQYRVNKEGINLLNLDSKLINKEFIGNDFNLEWSDLK